MRCSICGAKTKVIDTRKKPEDFEIYRRRRCSNPECGREFFTVEYEIDTNDTTVHIWRSIDRKYTEKGAVSYTHLTLPTKA